MKRPPDASTFPRGTHRVSDASSLCLHMAGNGKEELQRLSCVHQFFLDNRKHLSTSETSLNPAFCLSRLHSEAGVEAVAQ